MLIKNTGNRLWTVAGVQLIPGADAVDVPCSEADIKGVEELEVVKAKVGRPAKEDKDEKDEPKASAHKE